MTQFNSEIFGALDDSKDQARLRYQKTHDRAQDHGSRQAYDGHWLGHLIKADPYYARFYGNKTQPKPEMLADLVADNWTAEDQMPTEHAGFLEDDFVDDFDSQEFEQNEAEEVLEVESRQHLADDIPERLYGGKISKQQAWDAFITGVSQIEERPVAELEAEELMNQLRYTGRQAAAGTLDYKPLEDVDYLEGFSIKSW